MNEKELKEMLEEYQGMERQLSMLNAPIWVQNDLRKLNRKFELIIVVKECGYRWTDNIGTAVCVLDRGHEDNHSISKNYRFLRKQQQ